MSAAGASLLALLVVIILSCTTRVNVGLLAVAAAWVIGVYVAGSKPETVFAGFPLSLFLTLVGVTLLFGLAQANGTLAIVALRATMLVRGDAALLPAIFFLLAMVVSTIGPGAIASVALIAPLAMAIGVHAGVPAFMTALMVANGANAGNLSPISSTGVIVNNLMESSGIGRHEGRVWMANLAAHVVVSVAAYAAYLWWMRKERRSLEAPRNGPESAADAEPSGFRASKAIPGTSSTLALRNWFTLGVVAAWIAAIVFFRANIGLAAFAAAALLVLTRAADEREALRQVPWGVIVMVTGVTVLIAVLERTGGMDLFTTLLAQLATPRTVNGMIAFVTGVVSTYSSTLGVVLPAFLPAVPGLVQKLGGGDPLAVALSLNIGSALVDVSPLSTLGALCVATVNDPDEAHRLFRRLLLWGLSMTVVGAVLSQVFAGVVAR